MGNSTILITGANRGIGLELARQLSEKGHEILGTARRPDDGELAAIAQRVEPLDVADAKSVAMLAARLDGVPVDVLINNAGYLYRSDDTIDAVDYGEMQRTFVINTLGPLRVTQALMPNLRAGKRKMIVSISSQLGSIEESTGGLYSYRVSKTALNQINRIWSRELAEEGFICTVLHPGWVRTDMGGAEATYSAQESVAGLVRVIEGLTPQHNGGFFNFRGDPVDW